MNNDDAGRNRSPRYYPDNTYRVNKVATTSPVALHISQVSFSMSAIMKLRAVLIQNILFFKQLV